jgi:hypothetical protein
MSIDDLRPLERETLRIVQRGKGKYTWYQVSRVLPVYDYPGEEQNSSKILRRLESLGLLKSSKPEGAFAPRYDVTEAGLQMLEKEPMLAAEHPPEHA